MPRSEAPRNDGSATSGRCDGQLLHIDGGAIIIAPPVWRGGSAEQLRGGEETQGIGVRPVCFDGTVEPEINEQFNPDRTILKLSFVKRGSLGGDASTQEPTQATQGTTQDGKEIPTVYSLPELDLAIISLMKKDPTTSQTAIATALNANINTLKYRVLKLKEKGIVEREGTSQKGRWIVKL